MKKKLNHGSSKKRTIKIVEETESVTEKPNIKVDYLDDEDQGFGGWLK